MSVLVSPEDISDQKIGAADITSVSVCRCNICWPLLLHQTLPRTHRFRHCREKKSGEHFQRAASVWHDVQGAACEDPERAAEIFELARRGQAEHGSGSVIVITHVLSRQSVPAKDWSERRRQAAEGTGSALAIVNLPSCLIMSSGMATFIRVAVCHRSREVDHGPVSRWSGRLPRAQLAVELVAGHAFEGARLAFHVMLCVQFDANLHACSDYAVSAQHVRSVFTAACGLQELGGWVSLEQVDASGPALTALSAAFGDIEHAEVGWSTSVHGCMLHDVGC